MKTTSHTVMASPVSQSGTKGVEGVLTPSMLAEASIHVSHVLFVAINPSARSKSQLKMLRNLFSILIVLVGFSSWGFTDDNDTYHRFAIADLLSRNALFDRMQSTMGIGCNEEKNRLGELCQIDLSKNRETISNYLTYKLTAEYEHIDDIIKLAKCNKEEKMTSECQPYLLNVGLWMKESIIALKVQEKIKSQIEGEELSKKLDKYSELGK